MVVKKRGLGRGLDALLGGTSAVMPSHGGAADSNSVEPLMSPMDSELRKLSVDLLQPGKYQPRTDMHNDSLKELADSIKAQGVLQPIVVRKIDSVNNTDRYEIIAGERRWRAAQLAGLHDIPTIIRDVNDEAAIAMALIENIQREDLSPVEEATALQRLISEFDMTHQQAAEAVGRSRAAVSNLLRLLSLNGDVRTLLENGDVEMGHARAILTLEAELQSQVARDIVQKGLSVREAEELVRKLRDNEAKVNPETQKIDPNISRLQDDLSDKLGAKVMFHHDKNGKGKVVLHYNSLDELDGILAHIK